jgi:hypothetical protein
MVGCLPRQIHFRKIEITLQLFATFLELFATFLCETQHHRRADRDRQKQRGDRRQCGCQTFVSPTPTHDPLQRGRTPRSYRLVADKST